MRFSGQLSHIFRQDGLIQTLRGVPLRFNRVIRWCTMFRAINVAACLGGQVGLRLWGLDRGILDKDCYCNGIGGLGKEVFFVRLPTWAPMPHGVHRDLPWHPIAPQQDGSSLGATVLNSKRHGGVCRGSAADWRHVPQWRSSTVHQTPRWNQNLAQLF